MKKLLQQQIQNGDCVTFSWWLCGDEMHRRAKTMSMVLHLIQELCCSGAEHSFHMWTEANPQCTAFTLFELHIL